MVPRFPSPEQLGKIVHPVTLFLCKTLLEHDWLKDGQSPWGTFRLNRLNRLNAECPPPLKPVGKRKSGWDLHAPTSFGNQAHHQPPAPGLPFYPTPSPPPFPLSLPVFSLNATISPASPRVPLPLSLFSHVDFPLSLKRLSVLLACYSTRHEWKHARNQIGSKGRTWLR